MSAIPMPLLDRALEELPREQLILATRLAREEFEKHLSGCCVEINRLIDSRNRLQNELIEVSDERNAAKRALRSLREKLASYVVGLFWTRPAAPHLPRPKQAREKLITLAMAVEDPGEYRHHEHCKIDGHDIFCEGGH